MSKVSKLSSSALSVSKAFEMFIELAISLVQHRTFARMEKAPQQTLVFVWGMGKNKALDNRKKQ